MAQSFYNRILKVNLSNGTIRIEEPGAVYFRRYLGGWNMILDTLLREERYDLAAGLGALAGGPLALPQEPDAQTLRAAITRARAAGGELRLRDWLRELAAGPVPEASLREAEETVWRAGVRLAPAPGLHDLLDELAADQLPLAIVSNGIFGGSTLAGELERHGLRRPFPFVVSSADAGRRKPDPAPFQRALRQLRVAPQRAWFVGDAFAADVAGAAALGLVPIWLDPGDAEPPAAIPHRRLPDLAALHRLYLESQRNQA